MTRDRRARIGDPNEDGSSDRPVQSRDNAFRFTPGRIRCSVVDLMVTGSIHSSSREHAKTMALAVRSAPRLS
jgi:hypothetical protein